MNADFADDIALQKNTSAQAKSLQHNLERALASMSTQTSQNTYALIKEVMSPH